MEGLMSIGIVVGAAVGLIFVLQFFLRKNIPTMLHTIKSLRDVVMFFANLAIKDSTAKKNFKRIADFVVIAWEQVEVSKDAIYQKLVDNGDDPDDVAFYQDALTDEAMKIVEVLAKEAGIMVDGMTINFARMAVKFLCGFFRKALQPGPIETTVIDLSGIEDSPSGVVRYDVGSD